MLHEDEQVDEKAGEILILQLQRHDAPLCFLTPFGAALVFRLWQPLPSSTKLAMMGIGQTLYGRAPATVLTLASLVLSFLATRAREDYRLYCALGTGGLGKPCILSWLVHTLALRPLAIGREAAEDPDFVPLDDEEWAKRVAETRAGADREKGSHPLHARRPSMDLAALPPRNGDRPFAFGIIPHRQLTDVAPGGGDVQEVSKRQSNGCSK